MAEKKQTLDVDQKLWTREQAMEFLGVKKSKLALMLATDEIPHLRIGNKVRFIPEQLWAWAKKKTAS
jgi:excisionase family DNA binding protein